MKILIVGDNTPTIEALTKAITGFQSKFKRTELLSPAYPTVEVHNSLQFASALIPSGQFNIIFATEQAHFNIIRAAIDANPEATRNSRLVGIISILREEYAQSPHIIIYLQDNGSLDPRSIENILEETLEIMAR